MLQGCGCLPITHPIQIWTISTGGPYSGTAHAFSAKEVAFEERVASQFEMLEDQAWNTAENEKEVFSEHGKEREEEVAEGKKKRG